MPSTASNRRSRRTWSARPDGRCGNAGGNTLASGSTTSSWALDAGGILPTVALASASDTPYRLSWRLDLDLPNKHVFREPHSALPELFVYGSFQGRRVLIVDDEVTTGRTAANLTEVLTAAGADVVGVACLVEDTAGGARVFLTGIGIPLCALTAL